MITTLQAEVINVKKLFLSLPNDIRQALASLAVALALMCGSIFVLSSYMNAVRTEDSEQAMATQPADESTSDKAD